MIIYCCVIIEYFIIRGLNIILICGEGGRVFFIFLLLKDEGYFFILYICFFSGVEEYVFKVLFYLEICLGIKFLVDSMFRVTIFGFYNGMFLIIGSRGSGKILLVKVLCRRMAEKENLVRIFLVDCKLFRGG